MNYHTKDRIFQKADVPYVINPTKGEIMAHAQDQKFEKQKWGPIKDHPQSEVRKQRNKYNSYREKNLQSEQSPNPKILV